MERLANPRPLPVLHNRRTRYEAALIGPDGRPAAVLGYDAKRTCRALWDVLAENGPDVVRLSGAAADVGATWTKSGWNIGDTGFRVAWSGKTERDARIELENGQ
jgi:hypothetical protein